MVAVIDVFYWQETQSLEPSTKCCMAISYSSKKLINQKNI